jgi:uncharacterized protein (UPF0548 family)
VINVELEFFVPRQFVILWGWEPIRAAVLAQITSPTVVKQEDVLRDGWWFCLQTARQRFVVSLPDGTEWEPTFVRGHVVEEAVDEEGQVEGAFQGR